MIQVNDITLSPAALIAARAATGMTQQDAAGAAGISRATLQNAEAGVRVPHMDHVARLAHIYGVTVDSLLTSAANLPQGEGPAPHTPN